MGDCLQNVLDERQEKDQKHMTTSCVEKREDKGVNSRKRVALPL